MDKMRSARAAASRYRALVSASASISPNFGNRARPTRSIKIESALPRYDPENEAMKALEEALKHKDLTYHEMFRYAKVGDFGLMILGVICALLWAVAVPVTISAVGKWVQLVLEAQYCANEGIPLLVSTNQTNSVSPAVPPTVRIALRIYALALLIIIFVSSGLAVQAFSLSADNQTFRIRLCYFESVLRKDMAWLDNYVQREFGRHMTHDVTILRNGLGGRIPYLIYDMVTVPLLLYIAFTTDWLITLVTLSVLVPCMLGCGRLSLYFERRELEVEDELGYKSEAYAEQVLSNIKAVKLYGTQKYETERFRSVLKEAWKLWKYMIYTGICIFLLWSFYFFASALALYYGRRLIDEDYLNRGCYVNPIYSVASPIYQVEGGGAIFVIFISTVLVTLHISEIVIIVSMILETKKVATEVFFMIDWKARIDNMSYTGECPGAKAVGKIEFEDVCFKYPRKMEIMVLKHVNLTIGLGQLVAILGDSRSGKSTILRLIHRLYDPTQGYVFFDGRPVESLNVSWLRSQIGHVPQKPVLFNKTVEENVRFGKWSATPTEVEEACKIAGIHEDILILPQGYKTIVGQRGKLLTLGQRRRIAFARAYLQRPKVLLLDEPVNESGKDYEEAMLTTINELRQNTTVVITSSDINSIVRQCDRIYVMDQGSILQEGTHASLMESDGLYAMMENGIDAGILAERSLRLTSQLRSYNFAKTLRKWELAKARSSKRHEIDLESSSDFSTKVIHDEDEDTFYEYQRRTRATTMILGGFNTYHFARRNAEAYNPRTGDKGVKKMKNIGGLAILKRRLTKLNLQQAATDFKIVVQNPLPSTDSDEGSSRSLNLNFLQRNPLSVEARKNATEDTLSTGSGHQDEFWEEYETVLGNLDDDKMVQRSWGNLFSVGFHGWWYFLFAIIVSASVGFLTVLCHSIYGHFYEELSHYQTLFISSISPSIVQFFIFGIVAGIAAFTQNVVFTFGGCKLTSTLKVKLFQSILSKDLEWFDLPENDISILCHRLSIDTAAMENVRLKFKKVSYFQILFRQALLITFGVISESLFGIVTAISIVIYYTIYGPNFLVPYALIGIPLSIVFFVVLYIDAKYQVMWNTILDNILHRVAEMEVDVVVNIRTVITLGLEDHFLTQMTEELAVAKKKIFWESVVRGVIFALTRVFPYLIYIAMGMQSIATVDTRGSSPWHLVLFSELLIQFTIRAGIGLATLPNTESARAAATRMRGIFKAKLTEVSKPNVKRSFEGSLTLKVEDLMFLSPRNSISLNLMNFEVNRGGYLGIVGIGSDSGSSMLLNVLARFYKPTSGSILMNGIDIWSMDLDTFRNHTGFVEESPNLFDLSIKDNIIYGLDPNTVTIEEIIKVANDTKIHDFIIRLAHDYDTMASTIRTDDRTCGLLQRLVLARALIRNPSLLFVDGHTTSVNEEEDALLQQALEFCRKNRTTVVATERISTVQTADHIIVLQEGSIVERGTHRELIALKRLYYQMYMYQQTISQESNSSTKNQLDSTGDEARIKGRSLLAYERYLQKRMFPLVPRAHNAKY